MLVSEWFTFASVPKTGCHWVVAALNRGGVPFVNEGGIHLYGRKSGLPAITIERDPADWLLSWWMNIGGPLTFSDDLSNLFRLKQKGDSFECFVDRYCRESAGAIGRIFASYQPSETFRIERMNVDLPDFLMGLGVPVDADEMRLTPPQCATRARDEMTGELRERIRAAA